jgi:alpha-beta hydrolase superfamily lysophospholipase
MRRHPWWTILLLVVASVTGLNVVAYNHAYAMTHYSDGGPKTKRPESLSAWEKARVCLFGINVPRPSNRTTPASVGLSFTPQKFATTDGIDLEAWYIPKQEAEGVVVLVHGYSNCKSQLLPEAKALHEMGYATFLLDCRGSGGSSGTITTIGAYEANDVLAAAEQVRLLVPDRPLILYGRSMGSVAILRAMAVNGVKPEAVILECPFDRLISTVANRFAAMGLPSFPFAQLVVFWGGIQHDFDGFQHNPVDYAQQVHCPVLLLQGAKDTRVTKEQADSLYENIPGEKQLEMFENAGHESYLAVSPQAWQLVVSQFLSLRAR